MNRSTPALWALAGIQLVLGLVLWGYLLFVSSLREACLGEPLRAGPLAGHPALFWAVLAFLLLCSVGSILLKFPLTLDSEWYVALDVVFAVTAVFALSPFWGTVISVSTTAFDRLWRLARRRAPYGSLARSGLDNMANRALRFGLAWFAFDALGGNLPLAGSSEEPLPLLGAFLVYFVANNLLYLPTDLLRGTSFRLFLHETLVYDLPGSTAMFCLGYVMSFLGAQNLAAFFALSLLVLGAARTLLHEEREPGAVLQRLNEALCEGGAIGGFVTCVLARLDLERHRIRWANAGHVPPFLFREGEGLWQEMAHDKPALPLGIDPSTSYFSVDLELQRGDQVLVITDGVLEAVNAKGELFGFERLSKALRAFGGAPIGGCVHPLLQTVQEFSGDAPKADAATALWLVRSP